ncbi:MAG: nitroreductase family protein [Desulfatiglandaceae bacterium]
MELMDIIRQRRSIRKFTTDPVSDQVIDALLEAARLAPSGSNLQPWRFIVVKSEETKEKLNEVTPYKFALKAPVVFVCCADVTVLGTRGKRIQELVEMGTFTGLEMDDPDSGKYGNSLQEFITPNGYLALNVAIAVEHMVLRATDLGLGTCWIGRFDIEKTKQVLDLSNDLLVVSFLPVGYPAQFPAQRPRLPKDEILVKTI